MDLLGIVIIVGVVAVAVCAAMYFHAQEERKRRDEMTSLAGRLGLHFTADRDKQLPERFRFLDRLAEGSDRYALNVISGNYNDHRVLLFDYHYVISDGKNRQPCDISFFMLFLPLPLPELQIAPKGAFAKLAGVFGFQDINFESAEFSRAFRVRARDRKFAYDVCNPGMMQFLLGNRDLSIEIEGRVLALEFDRRLNTTEMVHNLTRLLQVRALMPKYLFP
jgi:hypothetical protein